MKTRFTAVFLTFLISLGTLHAADATGIPSWRARTLGEALLYMLLFAVVGIAVAIAGYKLFDRFTPGNLHQEIFENRNVAAAIIAGSVVLGICLIIAAAMIG